MDEWTGVRHGIRLIGYEAPRKSRKSRDRAGRQWVGGGGRVGSAFCR